MKFKKHIALLKEKNNESFEYIYHETKYAVYGIIIAIVKNNQVAEDVMQDTYIEMVSSIALYNEKYKFITWLLTIARNKAIDTYRLRKREYNIDITEQENLLPAVEEDQDNQYLANYYLSVLDEEERMVVIMYATENMKHKDIARVLDKPVGTITWIYNKALNKMRELARKES